MTERILLKKAGWCRVDLVEPPFLTAMVRFTESATGRIAIVELVFARFPGVTAGALRAFPLGRVEAWANGPGREAVKKEITSREALSAAEVADIDDSLRAEADMQARWGTSPEAQANEEAMLKAVADLGVKEQFAAGQVAIGVSGGGKLVVLRSRVRNLQLRIPDGQPKPDSFYREVARIFGELAVNTPRPAAVLAEANSVPISRIHGWIKEARRRGLLAPGERQARRRR